MRAIGYHRASEGDEGSPQLLERSFLSYCDEREHQPARIFQDEPGAGGFGAPAYRRMVDFMRGSTNQFLVVIPDARHLGGDLEGVARAMVELEAAGARVVCMDDESPDPLQNALKTVGVKGVSRTRSARITESMEERALRGQALGRPPYGYRVGSDGVLEVVPEEAAVVELVYRLYTRDGMGFRLIAQHLNERGILTRRHGQWNVVTIRDMLRNPRYTGTYSRFGVRLARVHAGIIPQEMFRLAQERVGERRPLGRVARAEPFELSGLAFCGYCGNTMMGVTRRQRWRLRDGRRGRGTYRYYQCQSRNNRSTCDFHTWRAALLEGAVLSQVRQALRAASEAGLDAGKEEMRKRRSVALAEARVRNAEHALTRAFRRAAGARIKLHVVGAYLGQLDAAREGLRGVGDWLDPLAVVDVWESLSFEQRRAFLERYVERVVVKDESVDVLL